MSSSKLYLASDNSLWRYCRNDPPIPTRSYDWSFWHEDYGGPDDACTGHAESEEQVFREIEIMIHSSRNLDDAAVNKILDQTPSDDTRTAHLCLDLLDAREKLRQARRALSDVNDLIQSSDGVAGLHDNGEFAPWDSLLEGGHYEEWMIFFSLSMKGKEQW